MHGLRPVWFTYANFPFFLFWVDFLVAFIISFGVEGVHVIDVSNPYQIEFVHRFDTEGKSYDLFVSDKFIYVADNLSLVILRLSRS